MRIDANLPVYLWNEVIWTAGYIANQTPMQKHKWSTPFEQATRSLPHLGHLQKIGCKVYALDKYISWKEKLQKRAHIGHLIEYDSTNIFRIWIPSQHKVIRTRDVIFDERFLYDPSELDLMQLTIEPMLDTCYDIPVSLVDPVNRIIEIESDEEDSMPITQHKTQHRLPPTPGLTEATLPSSPATSSVLSSAPNSPTSRSAETNLQTETRATEISATFDTGNILPEGVGRTRQPRRNVYTTALEKTA